MEKKLAGLLGLAVLASPTMAAAGTTLYGADIGPFASLEVLWLKPGDTEGQSRGFDAETTLRTTAGYAFGDGSRFLVRYMKYDEDSKDATSRYTGFKMSTLDLEFGSPVKAGAFSGLASAGVRISSYREEFDLTTPDYEKVSRGYGLVAGIELHRQIGSNFSIFGMTRGSINRTGKRVTETGIVLGRNYVYTIWDLQLGAEYRLPLGSDWTMFFRVSADAQYWSGIGDDDSEDVSLVGWGFTVGVR